VKTFLASAALYLSLITSWAAAAEFGHYRSLLLSGNLAQLEAEQQRINQGFVAGETSWWEYYQAFDGLWFEKDFDTDTHSAVAAVVAEWESKQSLSPYELLNLGVFYYEKGRHARGGKWANETRQQQMERMWQHYQRADKYLRGAIDRDSTLIQAYRTLINIYKNLPSAKAEPLVQAYVAKALEQRGDNYIIWHVVLHSQKPRWGGSYAQMTDTLSEIAALFADNSADLDMLNGMIAADQADMLIRKKRFDEAASLIESHEESGYPQLYVEKIQLARERKDYGGCRETAEYVLRYYPYDYYAMKSLGICSKALNDWHTARDAFYHYAQYKGRAAWQLYSLGKAYLQLHDYEKAYPLLKASIVYDPEYRKYAAKMIARIEQEHPDKTRMTLTDLGL